MRLFFDRDYSCPTINVRTRTLHRFLVQKTQKIWKVNDSFFLPSVRDEIVELYKELLPALRQQFFFGALAAKKPLVMSEGEDNLQGNRIVMVTKHHDPDPRRLRTSEK